jgi:serine protease Do
MAKRFGNLVAVALTVPFALVYWPVACATNPAVTASSAAETDHGGEGAAFEMLPHPAFALAEPAPSGVGAAISIADVAERVTPSVVNIASERIVKTRPSMMPFFFGPNGPEQGGGEQKQQGQGSGVIFSKDGIIITNNHVVEEATQIKVTTSDKREFDAEVVGRDARSDIAVLRLKGNVQGLRPVAIGDSSKMRLGEVVLAIGNPFGVGQTVTMGIVSATGRADVGIEDYEDFIQTDAAINPGNSGGALVNMKGELIGINTAILSRSGGYQGIGFAIPTMMVKPIADALLKTGRVSRGFLGVSIQDVNTDLAKALSLPDTRGVLITEVQPNGAAAKAGIQRGDAVVRVDGEIVDSSGRLRNLIAAKGANAKVKLDIIRSGKPTSVVVQTGELADTEAKAASDKAPGADDLGLGLSALDDQARRQLGMDPKAEGSVVIARVARGSKAADAGLMPGDVVLEVNRTKVTSVEVCTQLLKKGKGQVLLLVSRRGATQYVVLER